MNIGAMGFAAGIFRLSRIRQHRVHHNHNLPKPGGLRRKLVNPPACGTDQEDAEMRVNRLIDAGVNLNYNVAVGAFMLTAMDRRDTLEAFVRQNQSASGSGEPMLGHSGQPLM